MQNEETRELATLIASDIVTNVRLEKGFDDVVGHDAAKAALEEAVLMPMLHPDLFRQSGLGTQASSNLSSQYKRQLVQGDSGARVPRFVDLDLESFPGWWAAIVATYCPSRMVEHPKSKSTQPRYSNTRVALYFNVNKSSCLTTWTTLYNMGIRLRDSSNLSTPSPLSCSRRPPASS